MSDQKLQPMTASMMKASRLETENRVLRARIERLQAALEPFARNVEAVSLSATLGHITREDLWRARDALAGKSHT